MSILLLSNSTSLLKRWRVTLQGDYHCVDFHSLQDLQKILTDQSRHIILLHRSQIELNDIVALREISQSCKLFVLADHPNNDEGTALLKLGISGYGHSYMAASKFKEAVKVTCAGGMWIGQKLLQHLIQGVASSEESQQQLNEEIVGSLTQREREITEKVAQGLSNSEIASALDIAERTVKAHLTSIYEKTATRSRLQLALKAKQTAA